MRSILRWRYGRRARAKGTAQDEDVTGICIECGAWYPFRQGHRKTSDYLCGACLAASRSGHDQSTGRRNER